MEQVTALGLGAPSVSERVPGWRATIPGGGLVKVVDHATEDEAKATFEGMERTAQAGVWPEVATDLPVDQALGDGAASLLVRKGTVVIYVRDLSDQASGWVERLLPIL